MGGGGGVRGFKNVLSEGVIIFLPAFCVGVRFSTSPSVKK